MTNPFVELNVIQKDSFILWKYCVVACSGWTGLSTPGIRNVQCNYTNDYNMCSRTVFVNIYLSRSALPCNQRHSHTCTSWQRQCTSHRVHKDCCRIHRYLKHRQDILHVCVVVSFQDGSLLKTASRLETPNDYARASLCSQTSSSVRSSYVIIYNHFTVVV